MHTEYSLLDGIARVKKLVEMTKERGYSACAITDHGNMYGTLQFFEECIKAGIKPILGCEFYICNDLHKKVGKDDMGHIILLAKNVDGVYDSDPNVNPNAKKYDKITYSDVLAKRLGVMDSTATSLCMDNNIPIQVFALSDPENIYKAVMGEEIGTLVY